MCQRSYFSRSNSRMAEEAQLQAEEEFMEQALKMIRQQRNCLQIERLHLESLKQQLMKPKKSKDDKEGNSAQEAGKGSSKPSDSKPSGLLTAVDLMNLGSKQRKADQVAMEQDMECNNQELNLNLNATGSGFAASRPSYNQYVYNSDDDSSDTSDGDDVMIDMNMLMNGTAGRK